MFFNNKTAIDYRADIDGLRALAVFSVIFFHADLFFFRGGYIGVDIFFVISGYLITKIIISDLKKNKFSIVNFYERRIRRIIPALYFVIIIFFPIFCFYLNPAKAQEFFRTVLSTIGFFSNIFFWRTSGYFDTESQLKPLLHTWSLSLEEQFYLIFPIFLIFIWKFFKDYFLFFITSIICLSFFFAEYFVYSKPIASFFLLPTRGWEFLLGSVTFFIEKKKYLKKKFLLDFISLVGILFIFISIFFFDKETFTPSYLTLLPTTGTAFIILSSSKENVVNKLLSGKILVSLGLISYSLYLWHYPIFAFAKLQSQNPISSFENILLIFLTLLMSLISWKIIEGPFRNKKIISKKILFFTFFIFTSILILASFLSMKFLPNLYFNTLNDKEKYNFKLIEKHTVYDYEKAIIDNSECHFNSINLDNIFFKRYSECEKKYKKAVIILGDSHGINLYNIITKSLDKKFIVGFTQVGCRPHNGKRENKKNNCLFNEYLDFLNKKRESIEYLIYHQSGALLIKDKYNGRSYYESNLKNELDRFIVNNENVLKIISYLSNINNEVKILWVGPHIESHANFDNIKSFNNGFYVNKNNIKLFNKIEKNIENYLINKRNNINFLPFSKIYKIDRNFLLFNECITFRDKDHFSRCGEDIISQSLKIQTIEEYFN